MAAAFPAKLGRIAPELRRGGKKRKRGKLSLNLRAFNFGGVAEHFEGDQLTKHGGWIKNPWVDEHLEG